MLCNDSVCLLRFPGAWQVLVIYRLAPDVFLCDTLD